MTGSAAEEWFVRLPAGDALIRALALPHAGGGCAAFAPLSAMLADTVEVWGANLPGRQARFLEPAWTDLPALIDRLADAAAALADSKPYGIVGYCNGALLAYLLTLELSRRDVAPPRRLVAVSFWAPHRIRVDPELLESSSEEFWRRITSFGGTHPRLARDRDARKIFEAPLRADYQLIASFTSTDNPALDTPITVLSGVDDDLHSATECAHWSEYTNREFRQRTLPGGHWLLEESPRSLAEAIRHELSR